MGIIAIIAALLLEQWRPLSDRTAVAVAKWRRSQSRDNGPVMAGMVS